MLGKISTEAFLVILGSLFKILTKRKHSKFFYFIKDFFLSLVNKTFFQSYLIPSTIKAIKIVIRGKLKGKPRKSKFKCQLGTLGYSTFRNNIRFEKCHVYNTIGAFGFKL